MKKILKHTLCSGRSMVEMIGVLTIVGFLTLGGIWGFDRASKMLRINNLKDEISTLVANARSTHLNYDNYSQVSPQMLIGAGLVPEQYQSEDGTKIIHAMKGEVLVGPADVADRENDAFIIIYNGLDNTTCREIAVVSWGSDVSSGFLGMTIKKDGDLTVATSNLTNSDIQSGNGTFLPKDLPQGLIADTNNSCDCTEVDSCAIAWKFF